MKQRRWTFNKARRVWEPAILEEHIVREIIDRLWYQAKIPVWRVRERIPDKKKKWQQLSTPGIPDLIGYAPNVQQTGWTVPLFIEVKRPGGKHRPAQEKFIAEAKTSGCCAFFAESWQDVCDALRQFGINLC